jgi:hypothetical protein
LDCDVNVVVSVRIVRPRPAPTSGEL